jgi:hypothetical protein
LFFSAKQFPAFWSVQEQVAPDAAPQPLEFSLSEKISIPFIPVQFLLFSPSLVKFWSFLESDKTISRRIWERSTQ